MTEDFISAAATFPDPFRLLIRESAASTNDEARTLGENGAASGLVVLALEQTSGRGRRGATWFSSAGDSLAFSILIRPSQPKSLWPRLALAAGLAVAEAAEPFGVHAGIKWPNDIWVQRLKLAGILVEAGSDFAVIGIGVNVNTREFPHEVADLATSLHLESGRTIPRPDVLAAIIRRFAARQSQIGENFDLLLDSVRQRCVLTGREISLTTSQGPKRGTMEGIGNGGELLLRTRHGLEPLIQADEVRILE